MTCGYGTKVRIQVKTRVEAHGGFCHLSLSESSSCSSGVVK